MNAKLTAAQETFLEFLQRNSDASFAVANATMKALLKKGVIAVDEVKKTPSGIAFKTYRVTRP